MAKITCPHCGRSFDSRDYPPKVSREYEPTVEYTCPGCRKKILL